MNGNVLSAFAEGSVIAVVGMLVVFSFLTIMVFTIDVMTKVVNYLNEKFPTQTKEATTKKKPNSVEDEVAVAIAAAINAKRSGIGG